MLGLNFYLVFAANFVANLIRLVVLLKAFYFQSLKLFLSIASGAIDFAGLHEASCEEFSLLHSVFHSLGLRSRSATDPMNCPTVQMSVLEQAGILMWYGLYGLLLRFAVSDDERRVAG